MRFFSVLFTALILFGCSSKPKQSNPIVILISFDGFRFDYVDKYPTPTLHKLASQGYRGIIRPSYPSKTFPNHYTLVTGLYPGNHGLVDNTFYDSQRGELYTTRNRDIVEDPYYYGGTPLWQLVQQNGLKSASYFWVGSEAPVQGSFPDYYYIYDGKVPNKTRVDQVIDWLNMPEPERPSFITLYFSMTDTNGHIYGPDADEVKEVVMEADSLVSMLVAGIDQTKLDVDVIVTADHGMLKLHNDSTTFIYYESLIQLDSTFNYASGGTHSHLYNDDKELILETYQSLKSKEDRFKVFLKDSIPEHYNYQHDRVGDILMIADIGHEFRSRTVRPENRKVWGNHGFDPYQCEDMGAYFLAFGPSFQHGYNPDPVQNIHVYPLICSILNIQPPEIDGNLDEIKHVLKGN